MTVVQRACNERSVISSRGGGGKIAFRSYTASDE